MICKNVQKKKNLFQVEHELCKCALEMLENVRSVD